MPPARNPARKVVAPGEQRPVERSARCRRRPCRTGCGRRRGAPARRRRTRAHTSTSLAETLRAFPPGPPRRAAGPRRAASAAAVAATSSIGRIAEHADGLDAVPPAPSRRAGAPGRRVTARGVPGTKIMPAWVAPACAASSTSAVARQPAQLDPPVDQRPRRIDHVGRGHQRRPDEEGVGDGREPLDIGARRNARFGNDQHVRRAPAARAARSPPGRSSASSGRDC